MLKHNLVVYCDGGARGNPGPAAVGVVIFNGEGNLRDKCGKYLGITTNNEAEYAGVIEALSHSELSEESHINFFLDSLLVVQQLNGLWKVKEPRLRELVLKIRQLEAGRKVTYTHIPREKNRQADLLVNETLDKQQ